MGAIAEAVRHMVSAGMPVDAVVEAVAAMEKHIGIDEQAQRRRAADRERKRAIKDGIPRNSADSAENAEGTPPSPTPSPQTPQPRPHPPVGNTPAREEPVAKSRIGTRIGDFEPSIEVAVGLGLTPERARLEADSFKDYWISKPGAAGRKLDWLATWRIWTRDKVVKGQTGLRVIPGQGPPKQRDGDRARSTLDRMIAEAEGAEHPANDRHQQHERTIDGYAQRSR